MAKTQAAAAVQEQDLDQYPDPKMPRGRAGSGRYAGKTLIANPKLGGDNPRRANTHGYRFHEKVKAAGLDGIKIEDLRRQCDEDEELEGFGNHLTWELKKNYVLIVEDLTQQES